MPQCKPKNNAMTQRANRFKRGVIAHQDECLDKSRRLQGETDQKGNRKATVALGRMEALHAEIEHEQARLKQDYCRERLLKISKLKRAYLDACEQRHSYR